MVPCAFASILLSMVTIMCTDSTGVVSDIDSLDPGVTTLTASLQTLRGCPQPTPPQPTPLLPCHSQSLLILGNSCSNN